MISAIKFGSTYKISSKDNGFEKLWKLQSFTHKTNLESTQIKAESTKNSTDISYTIIAPDETDKTIETFCANNGINFKKMTIQSLLNPQRIINRTNPAPEGKIKTIVNYDKLKSLSKKQNSNIEHCKDDYLQYYKKEVNSMLKSGDNITPTSVYITNNDTKHTKDLIEYIKKYGADNLNDNQISIIFNQETDYPDHCMYFAMHDNGMKNIPILVNQETYLIGSALGLFNQKI